MPAEAPSFPEPAAASDESSNTIDPVPAPTQETATSVARRFAQLDSAPDAIWYVRPSSGGQYGPAGGDLLCEWIEQGRVGSSSLLWRDGWAQWRSAEEVLPELSVATPPIPPANIPGIPAAPVVAVPPTRIVVNEPTAEFQGDNQPGVIRSKRKQKRIKLISLMLAICLLLIGALVIAIYSSS
ncbi:DUF4339 domain-containing protein [Roseimaritima multifibrata]|uniref:DUF4339 domain-containing protein n=1 Tax=Roseimaritima multifibrata TaxID=1930274 RepID=UPI001C54FBE3|nr:DUF4339 domain-containing protein [Roseimaritima multifibrata]